MNLQEQNLMEVVKSLKTEVSELKSSKMQFEALNKSVADLQAQKKAFENMVKNVKAELAQAKEAAEQEMHLLRQKVDNQKAELRAEVRPLEDMKRQVEAHKHKVARMQAEEAETRNQLRHERQKMMDELDRRLAMKQKQLDQATASVDEIKGKVAAL